MLPIANDIFRNATEMEYQLTPRAVWFRRTDTVINRTIARLNKRIEQPEFYILNVCFIKVNFSFNCIGDTSPIGFRVCQKSVVVEIRVIVVCATFTRVVGNVKNLFIENILLTLTIRENLKWT